MAIKRLSETTGFTENPVTNPSSTQATPEPVGVPPTTVDGGSQSSAPLGTPLETVVDTPAAPATQTAPSQEAAVTPVPDIPNLEAAFTEQEDFTEETPYDPAQGYSSVLSGAIGQERYIQSIRQPSDVERVANVVSNPSRTTTYQSVLPGILNTETPGMEGNTDYIRYSNQNAVRNQPVSEELATAMSFLPDMGITMEVFSGGQDAEGENRVGSHRHDHGGAADVYFYKDGRKLDWANASDRPIFQQIVRSARANGITGIGAGPGYMQQGSMHIGFGTEAVWGAGGSSENAPQWLRNAFYANSQG